MYFSFLVQLVVDCTKLIFVMRFSDKQKPYFLTFSKVLNIIDRHSSYTYIIPCTGEFNAAAVIHIVAKHFKPTIGLPLSIVLDQNVLFMQAEFQYWLIKNGVRHKVYTAEHTEPDSQTEIKNR